MRFSKFYTCFNLVRMENIWIVIVLWCWVKRARVLYNIKMHTKSPIIFISSTNNNSNATLIYGSRVEIRAEDYYLQYMNACYCHLITFPFRSYTKQNNLYNFFLFARCKAKKKGMNKTNEEIWGNYNFRWIFFFSRLFRFFFFPRLYYKLCVAPKTQNENKRKPYS